MIAGQFCHCGLEGNEEMKVGEEVGIDRFGSTVDGMFAGPHVEVYG